MKTNRRKFAAYAVPMISALALSLGAPAYADAPTGAASEVKNVAVTNIEGAASVTAYRIVEPTFDASSGRFTGYKRATGVNIADIESPTAAEITNIAKAVKAGTLSLTSYAMTASGTSYSKDLPAGSYVVLVTDTANADYIYNPMVISVEYSDANDLGTNNSKMVAKGVSADTSFTEGTNEVYAKRSTIPFDKTITSPDAQKAVDTDISSVSVCGADDLQVGDTGHFQLYSVIPEYSAAYTSVTYNIADQQADGFSVPSNIKVYVDESQITQGEDTALVTKTGNDFTVAFASDFVLAHTGDSVKVTYDAVLSNSASMGFSPNVDSATLTYTNDLDGHSTEKTDSVKEHTFSLNGELIKVERDNSPSVDGYVPLSGATFSLTRVETGDDKAAPSSVNLGTMTTDTDGKLKWDRLDEGTYKIRETSAPTGYTVDNTEYTVVITPTYSGDGAEAVLQSYTVVVSYTGADGEAKSQTFTYDNNASTEGEVSTTTAQRGGKTVITATNAVEVINVKTAHLPATGAHGTLAFALIGAVGMAVVAVLIARNRKKAKG